MNYLITGVTGYIGSKLVEAFLDKNFENLVLIAPEGFDSPFATTPNVIWINKNLDEATPQWWYDLATQYKIQKIYYLESVENQNLITPTIEDIFYFQKSDNAFFGYLTMNSNTTNQQRIDILYLSTDKLYKNDNFPHENHRLILDDPKRSQEDEVFKTFDFYIAQKYLAEIFISKQSNIKSRIIRPFNIVGIDRNPECVLYKLIDDAIDNKNIYIKDDGSIGISFTHVTDFINFLISEKLFDDVVGLQLSSNVINFCKTSNYITTWQLAYKIVDKLYSYSTIYTSMLKLPKNVSEETELYTFENIMNTPQVFNMSYIYDPIIPIDQIIEEIAYSRQPQNKYQSLKIDKYYFDDEQKLNIIGSAEPGATISAMTYWGYGITSEVDLLGKWHLIDENVYPWTQNGDVIIYAIAPDGVKYETEVLWIETPYKEEVGT